MRTTIRAASNTLAVAAILGVVVTGQNVPSPLTFEVSTVKPASGDDHHIMLQMQPGGGLRTMGTPVKMLIMQAYDVRRYQITGGPAWLDTEAYDITAKPASPDAESKDPREMTDADRKTIQEKMRARLQALLADRFQLTIHHETKEQPIYTLVVAKSGSKLKTTDSSTGQGPKGMMRMSPGGFNGQGVELKMLAEALSNPLGRTVVDRTGLSGRFDVDLQWTPDASQREMGPMGGPPPPGMEMPAADPNRPSIFTAIQEQLGLRLESAKGPVDMIVIDRVGKPTEN
jgi:uncharacterized protein (TIGR03435 family)